MRRPPEDEDPVILSDRNWAAYEHYRECKAVSVFPDEAVVRYNAAIIAEALESARDEQQWQILRTVGGR